MSQVAYGAPAPTLTPAPRPLRPPGLNPAAQRVLAEIELWCPLFASGELVPEVAGRPALAPRERFAVHLGEVRAAGRGHAPATGALHATDRRAVIVGEDGEAVRDWALDSVGAIQALGNWGGIAIVHETGDTELVVAAKPELPSWRDASGWLKVEAAFAAAGRRLEPWLADLPHRLALATDA